MGLSSGLPGTTAGPESPPVAQPIARVEAQAAFDLLLRMALVAVSARTGLLGLEEFDFRRWMAQAAANR